MGVVVVGWLVYAALNAGSARKEVGSEIELAANRKPYYDDEVLEGRRLERVQLMRRAAAGRHRHRPAAVLDPRAGPSGRRHGGHAEADGRAGAQLIFAPTGDNPSAFNCSGCHGGMNATGGVAPYTVTDQVTGEVRSVDVGGAGAEHRAVPLRRVRGALHPHLRPPRLADVGMGPRRRRADERPADRRRSSPTSGRSRSPRRTARPRRRATRCCESGHLPADIQADIETCARQSVEDGTYDTLRRGAVQPLAVERRLQLRPLPHQGLELRRSRRARARARSAGTSPVATPPPSSPTSRT